MNQEQKNNLKELIAALRSGKYKQGRAALHEGDEFCCLGVACDLFKEKTGEGDWVGIGTGAKQFKILSSQADSYSLMGLSKVQKFFGFKGAAGFEFKDGLDMIGLNDDKELSFKRIATRLEKKLNEE